jgi:hypothetical protein
MNFICPWGTFSYHKMPFGLKNGGATLQCAMTFVFHNIKHIVEAYLENIVAHSQKRVDHLTHLRILFERCHYYHFRLNPHKFIFFRYYHIRLNPHKCIFCVRSGFLLGFIVSTTLGFTEEG